MTGSIEALGLAARDEADAGALIAGMVEECRRGASDREAEAVALAELWGFEVDPVRERFAIARDVRAKPAEVFKRRKLPPDEPKAEAGFAERLGTAIARERAEPARVEPKAEVEVELAAAKSRIAELEAAKPVRFAPGPGVAAPSALFGKEVPAAYDGPPILSRNVPMDAARKFSDKFCWRGGFLGMYCYRGEFYQWNGSHYAKIDERAVLGEIYAFLDGAKVRNGNGEDVRYILRARDASEILECLKNGIILPSKLVEPYWLDREEPAPSIIAFKNCLVDYETGEVVGPTPKLWVTDALGIEFDRDAKAPRFEQFLEEIQPGDREAQQCLLEQLGYGMTNETKFDKAALWYGVLRSGKSTLARIQHKLVGDRSFAALDIHNITKTENSAQILIGRKVGVFADVRMRPPKWYGNNYDPGGLDHKVAQLILNVTGRDAVSLGQKYKEHWEGRLTTKFILISNDVPNFGDVANVLPTRFIKVHFRKSFEGKEDVDLQASLDKELPGIANLCLAALRTLLDRGHFIQPASSKGLEQRVLARTNPIAEFMQDTWVRDDGSEGPTCADFYKSFTQWANANGHTNLVRSYPRQKLIQAINDLAEWAWLKSGNRTQAGGGKRRYPGIRRKTEGDV